MAGVYRPQHPERTVLFRVLFHYSDRFPTEYESRFKIEYGFFRRCWVEMIRKVYEVDPMVCLECGGTMKVIAFITNYSVVDKTINRLKLSFVAERPPPLQIVNQEVLMAIEASTEHLS